jgi:hypothetical protein
MHRRFANDAQIIHEYSSLLGCAAMSLGEWFLTLL